MSGGIAYVYDNDDDFITRCNLGMVVLEKVETAEDTAELKGLIERHQDKTDSSVAARILESWDDSLPKFIKVMPVDYKRVLEENRSKAGVGAAEEMEAGI
ncbi:MAG: hypothetical protein CMQ48_06415 [Gammaproteobacteria bacterium]|nr:hypothetical protein [Gammaproteobacteria bacterium]